MADQPAALVDQDTTPVVLRVEIGHYFDVMGMLDLHESGKVTVSTTSDPTWVYTVRGGFLMCWRGDDSRPPARRHPARAADALGQLPVGSGRIRSYRSESVGDARWQTRQTSR